jgi:hypothetical protein
VIFSDLSSQDQKVVAKKILGCVLTDRAKPFFKCHQNEYILSIFNSKKIQEPRLLIAEICQHYRKYLDHKKEYQKVTQRLVVNYKLRIDPRDSVYLSINFNFFCIPKFQDHLADWLEQTMSTKGFQNCQEGHENHFQIFNGQIVDDFMELNLEVTVKLVQYFYAYDIGC